MCVKKDWWFVWGKIAQQMIDLLSVDSMRRHNVKTARYVFYINANVHVKPYIRCQKNTDRRIPSSDKNRIAGPKVCRRLRAQELHPWGILRKDRIFNSVKALQKFNGLVHVDVRSYTHGSISCLHTNLDLLSVLLMDAGGWIKGKVNNFCVVAKV